MSDLYIPHFIEAVVCRYRHRAESAQPVSVWCWPARSVLPRRSMLARNQITVHYRRSGKN